MVGPVISDEVIINVDDGQQAYCRKCQRTPLECAKAIAPECAYMQSRIVQAAHTTGAVQRTMSVSAGYVARSEVIPLAVKMIEEKAL